ncbi:sugar O-acyltransferase (sialic acid O-acetyltransferase NeuD family) [Hungatella effluvii]|uniref:Sugar O-acyltransferase (Sialic acid O-acetyltransferase NeuD family) n=1 Tax=Hungatella effluvii TaxID=1096246 RepID=A0A2V3XWL8_9FIRM|nr:acetyltransferase [Hungatella effluvii]PXX43522.1 sugar O-acyltransferase (sialic acid O-acetyltransferase NeuD family) [Hungatella effluvii]
MGIKNLVIIGAGGCGREVLQWANDINEAERRWNIKGFIDDDLNALNEKRCSVSVLSKIDDYKIDPEDEFVCCIGNSGIRKLIVEKLKKKGAVFTMVTHPNAVIANNCILGEGVIIYPFALISDNAILGDGCIINMHSSVAHDSVLGEYCTISAHCDITGMCRVGNRVFMGSTSHMIPGTTIGDDVYICAGSSVMSRVRSGMKVLGNPAKIVKF